jgi:L-seryl-tRNA(Ser) seleniumtransferase
VNEEASKILRSIPSVGELLASGPVADVAGEFGAGIAKLELRSLLDESRDAIRSGKATAAPAPAPDEIAADLRARLTRFATAQGRAAINAAGILLHTGLGRAPLCEEALDALAGMGGYTILQTNIETGGRSGRTEKIEKLLIELTGCEAATVVNNNAAATMIILNTLAEGREVVISRGQLVEIGGSFRMPDVMARSGCILREVGATNRTHLRDYEDAISMKTGALMHVHTSNYRIRGFAGVPTAPELIELGKAHGVPVIDDLGSGALVPLSDFGLADEPLVRDSIAASADAVCFSADKLICGPQSGVICGSAFTVERIRKNPYARMFRVSKLELAALEATLLHFVNGTHREALPFYRMLSQGLGELEERARAVAAAIGDVPGASVEVGDDLSYVGSGSAPDEGVPTKVVRASSGRCPADKVAHALRTGLPSVFARISEDRVLFDMRTVAAAEVEPLVRAARRALGAGT